MKTFTQEQVNAMIGNARREAREAAQRELQQQPSGQQQQQQPAPSAAKPTSPKSDADRLAQLESELAETRAQQQRIVFDGHAARLGIDANAAGDLFQLAQAQKPENVGLWLEQKAALFGLKPAPAPAGASAPAGTPATAPSEPAKPPAAAPAAPAKVDPLTSAGLVDIWNLSEAQLKQLGPQGLRTEYEKILAVGRQQSGAPPRPKLPGRS